MNRTKQTLQLFWQHIARYPFHTGSLSILVPAAIVFHQFLPPLVIANVLDRLSSGDFVAGDLWLSFGGDILLYAALFFTGSVVLWRIADLVVWRLEFKVVRDMAQRMFDQLLGQSARFHADRFGGSLVSQATKFTGAYVRFADTTVFNVSGLVVAFVTVSIILFPRAPLFIAVLYAFSVVYIIVALLTTKKVRKFNAEEAEASNKQTGQLADAITNVMTVKSFAAGDFERRRFVEATEQTRAAGIRMARATIFRDFAFTNINALIMVASLVAATASVVIFHNADIATVFLIFNYTANISGHLWGFSTNTLRNYNRALGDAREMTEILNEQPEVKDPEHPEEAHMNKGAISFDGVVFSHTDESDDSLFDTFSLDIAAGEKIGLVGHSGSGKTTLTRLLLRFSDLDGGVISIDGQNIARLKQDDVRKNIAYVPQEPLLFHRTLRENIAYGKLDATEAEVRAAAKKAHAAEFIDKLPDGYETLVGERGVKLSGGQRQRIAIARAILKDAPILVLDEATSALDSESEQLIQKALWELMKGRTAIVIAHRLSTIQRMDRIVVLDNGAIVEQGSHTQLLRDKGVYADLWAHQSGGFLDE